MPSDDGALLTFIPSGPDFELGLRFFSGLGFELRWRSGGRAGLRLQERADDPRGREEHIVDP